MLGDGPRRKTNAGRRARTQPLELLELLVVLPAQPRPLGKLVLAAGGVQLAAELEVLALQRALLVGGIGSAGGDVLVDVPELRGQQGRDNQETK